MNGRRNSGWHVLATIGIVSVLILVTRFSIGDMPSGRVWLGALVLIWILVFTIGHWITGTWRGALVNDRNRISLSQTQLILWTTIVLAAFLTGTFENIANGYPDPLSIAVPESLWLLMGISTTSLIGSPLISSRKKAQKADDLEQAMALNTLSDQGKDASEIGTSGRLLANDKISDARWSDLFEAEELSRAGRVDMSKVQMTFFTLIVAVVYATQISNLIGADTGFRSFPELSDSMVVLIGISHAGYLTAKAVPEREGITYN